ncbi:MAG: hypothetical protein CSA39_06855 [Flavobacteriales bacterium]|nr:MAG: hypothetical protein CSA39_06855 [Flavobacteriales bacterium]
MSAEKKKNLNNLIARIIDRVGNPVNENVIVSTIESLGIRNKDTQNDYGINSIFELAKEIYNRIKSDNPKQLKNLNERLKLEKETVNISSYFFLRTKLFLKYFPLGLIYFFPIFIQIVAILIFSYSIWTYLGFHPLQSTAVVFGVILGLISTGGFVQVIGKQSSFYWYNNDLPNTKKSIYDILKTGIKFMAGMFLFILIANFFLNLYPFSFFSIAFTYAFLIGLLLLFLAPMHTIKQRWVISVAVFIGTGVAILLKLYSGLHIYITHWIGIAIAIGIMAIYLRWFFKDIKSVGNNKRQIDQGLVIIYKNYQYFFYGLLIYVFLFIDRILAWSTMENEMPFIVYYEVHYEVGMDIAILMFFLLAGVIEYNIASFSKMLNLQVKSTPHKEFKKFNQMFYDAYYRQSLLLIINSIAIFIFMFLIITRQWGYNAFFEEPLNFISKKVSLIGALGYMFFTWGVLNSLYLFSLDRPKPAVHAVIFAIVINIFVGLILSRLFSYEYSAIGMVVGAFVFMALTAKACLNCFKNLDYYYATR